MLASSNPRKLIYIENYGCAANKSDMEVMLGYLVNEGYRIVKSAGSADILLIDTCGVKKPTEDRMLHRLRVLSRTGKPLLITGCLPRINLSAIRKAAPLFACVVDPHSINKIIEAVRAAERGERGRLFFSDGPFIKVLKPKLRLNKIIEIVQIAEGCVGACSFCCVRSARGKLFSYPKEVIVDRIKRAVSEGVKEVWITSQDNGAYGLDIKTNLVELLRECCKIEGNFLTRVGMMNPNHAFRMIDRLVHIYKEEKLFKFVHLPVQSGDDYVLKTMNRLYSVKEFEQIIYKFRSEIPEVTVSTDIICGFPTESQESFKRTLDLIEKVQPDVVNISKFFPRPGTLAARMKQLPIEEVKDRSRKLSRVVRRISYKRNESWVNWEGRILIDEKGYADSWIGRNFAYKPVVVKSNRNLLGTFINVRVLKAYPTYLEAVIIE